MTRNQTAASVAAALVVIATIAVLARRPHAPAPAAASSAAPQAPADCLLPGPPPVPPHGDTANAEDMKLGREVMQGFVDQLEAYQTCRNAQIDHAPPGTSDDQKQQWVHQGNLAVDEAHALADAYGAQLRAFKARSAGQ